MPASPTPPPRAFISYSHQNKEALTELQQALAPLVQDGLLEIWDDTRLAPGQVWLDEIRRGLSTAHVGILLLSPPFLTSAFISSEEAPLLLKAARQAQIQLVPVFWSQCDHAPPDLSLFQAANNPAEPLDTLLDAARRQDAWQQVAQQIKTALEAQHRLKETRSHPPLDYLPLESKGRFQARSGEFETLEDVLFPPVMRQLASRPAAVGLIGLGGVGKSQLAVELATRNRFRFPQGLFWMPATGTQTDWQHRLAELALQTGYLPPDDAPGQPDNELRRARHFAGYLAKTPGTVLILDNVDEPELVTSVLPALTTIHQPACALLYTSRMTQVPEGAAGHMVTGLPEEGALRLLLEEVRPAVWAAYQAKQSSQEVQAAQQLCQGLGFLPLGLVHLQGLLRRDRQLSVTRLTEVVKQRGALEMDEKASPQEQSLFATFRLSWEQVKSEAARQLLYLAGYFPEAAPIPLWLLGRASGLGEVDDQWEPLGEARLALEDVSLLEPLAEGQVRLHPLVRAFARRLVAALPDQGQQLTQEASQRLVTELTDLGKLEERARRVSYLGCLEQVRAALAYADLLGVEANERLSRIERWLDRESYLLGPGDLWPERVPGLFFQQFHNRTVEVGQPLAAGTAPEHWMRQFEPVEGEDPALLRMFVGHRDIVSSVAFSPDGRKVLTGSFDRTARLWETNSGKLLGTLEGHQDIVSSVAFSPDGRQVLTGSWDRTARLWEASSGRSLLTLEGHQNRVTSVAFSPDGKQVLTGSKDRTARLWEASSGRSLLTLEGHQDEIGSVTFSPDGEQVLTGSDDGKARLWEARSGKRLGTLDWSQLNRVAVIRVTSVAFSPDGSQVLMGTDLFGWALLWEVSSGKLLFRLEGHQSEVRSVAFSPDGRQVLTGSDDKTARLWEVSSGKLLRMLEGHQHWVISVAFSPDGKQVLTGSRDQTARLWEASSGRLPGELGTLEGHEGEVSSAAFSPGGRQMVTGSYDWSAGLWEASSGKRQGTLKAEQVGEVTSVAFSPDGKQVLAGSVFGRAWLWEASSGRLLGTLGAIEGHTDWITSVAFSPDGKQVLTGSRDRTARFWKVGSGKQVLVGSEDQTAPLWEWDSKRLLKTLKGHRDWVTSVAFSPGGGQVLTGSRDQTARLWETSSGKLLLTLKEHQSEVLSVAFSPDGKQVLTGSKDQTARLWEASSGKPLGMLKGHQGWVSSVAFSPDGRLIVTCDGGGRVYWWDSTDAQAGQLLALYPAAYPVLALHWLDHASLLLADTGGPRNKPNIYRLMLMGW